MTQLPSTPATAALLTELADRKTRLKRLLKSATKEVREPTTGEKRGELILSAEIADLERRIELLNDLESRGVPCTHPDYVRTAAFDPTAVQTGAIFARENGGPGPYLEKRPFGGQ